MGGGTAYIAVRFQNVCQCVDTSARAGVGVWARGCVRAQVRGCVDHEFSWGLGFWFMVQNIVRGCVRAQVRGCLDETVCAS